MKSKHLGILLVIVVALFTGYTTYSSHQTNTKLADLSLVNIESLAGENDDTMDGGELDGTEIVCSSGGSGRCYASRVRHESGGYCSIYCEATGDPKDYCNAIWMGILELCVNIW